MALSVCPTCKNPFRNVAIHVARSSCGENGAATGNGDATVGKSTAMSSGVDQPSRGPGGASLQRRCVKRGRDTDALAADPLPASLTSSSSLAAPSIALAPAFEDCCIGLLAFFLYDRKLFDEAIKETLRCAVAWLKLEVEFAFRSGKLCCPLAAAAAAAATSAPANAHETSAGSGASLPAPSDAMLMTRQLFTTLCFSQPFDHSAPMPAAATDLVGYVLGALQDRGTSAPPLSVQKDKKRPSVLERSPDETVVSSSRELVSRLLCIFRGPRRQEVAFLAKILCGVDDEPLSPVDTTEAPAADLVRWFYDSHPAHRAVHARQLFTNGLFQFFQFHPKTMQWAAELAVLETASVKMSNHADLANMVTLYIVTDPSVSSQIHELMSAADKVESGPPLTRKHHQPHDMRSNFGPALVSVSVVRDRFLSSFQSLQEQTCMGRTKLELLLQFCNKYGVPSSPAVDASLFGAREPPAGFQDCMQEMPRHLASPAAFAEASDATLVAVHRQLQHQAVACFLASLRAADDAVTAVRVWAAGSMPIDALHVLCHNTASSSPHHQFLMRLYRLPLTRKVTKAELVQGFWTDELLMVVRNVLLSTMQSDAERWALVEQLMAKSNGRKPLLRSVLLQQPAPDATAPKKEAHGLRVALLELLLAMSTSKVLTARPPDEPAPPVSRMADSHMNNTD